MLVVWLHRFIGLHYWLRLRASHRRLQPVLLTLAVLMPTLALTGFVAAGREIATLVGELAAFAATNDWPIELWHFAFVLGNAARWIVGLATVLALLLAARMVRSTLQERRQSCRIDYDDGRRVRAVSGTTLLEASRMQGIPYAAFCGGRGSCSTCRVRITDGLEGLLTPEPSEARLLERLDAPPDVRLACQLRPVADLAVLRPMPETTTARATLARLHPGHRVEREVAVLFADLRGFTTSNEGRLTFDVVHLLNR
jgi:adenylate cyclase